MDIKFSAFRFVKRSPLTVQERVHCNAKTLPALLKGEPS